MPRLLLLPLLLALTTPIRAELPLKFDFEPTSVSNGCRHLSAETVFSRQSGFGFEPGAAVMLREDGKTGEPCTRVATSDRPFHFTATVPHEGNYRVSVTVGDAPEPSVTTIKAELRRLMIEKVETSAGEYRTVRFIVNVRTPQIAARNGVAAGAVQLKAPRETIQEAWDWDNAITLEFLNRRPAICRIEIEPVTVPTIYLLGDSTVCDQSKEPYSSWGQMLPRFFGLGVAVANHAESGETYRDSLARRRLDKIVSLLQPGDLVLMQFGHNDQKQIAAGTGGPFTTYAAELKRHVEAIRGAGGTPVIVSPMERLNFTPEGKIRPSLTDYAAAAKQTAAELHVPFLDLHAMSIALYEALGPERAPAAFAAPKGKLDRTHHDNYGSYELAKCIVAAIVQQKLSIARYVADDFTGFDPRHPDPLETFAVAPSGDFTNERPLGD